MFKNLTPLHWALICGLMNATAVGVVMLLAIFTGFSNGQAMLIGSLFVIVSIWPFQKAKQLHFESN